ncbi:hypothetical protein J4N45_05175 [Vibrio sp. SCSIO 43140]|uniref:hypothetical protein n=1 Tax=Vibrio sp. SCSIO 43140 TaxID=2819100 RepID=UPI002074C0E0|nr:hypothetical protein [Vibrio sp. SCSIO 43140]USD61358.1 hypothetical protein J4N45_05175 [Vibrio sp. SCSIO 43140]
MKYKLLTMLVGSTILAGCASNVSMWDNREELLADIEASCVENTKGYTEYAPAFDQASKGVLSVTKRQCEVVGEYQNIRKEHKDVQQFFAMHSDKSKEEIVQLLNDDPKMQSKYNDYTKAQSKIFNANLELAIKLGVQAIEVTNLAASNATAVAKAEAYKFIQGAIDPEEHPIGFVVDEMQTRVGLITDSNGLISAEQQFIKDMDAADKAIKERIGQSNDEA